jgi:predicted kinase
MRDCNNTEASSDLAIPDFALVVLIGSTGSGKSTFAAKHFLPTEVISSDRCRALVSDDETDQDVSADAFDLVREIAGKRLKHRKLTVIDATNVRAADRKAWVELARKWHALPIAIVIDPGVDVCVARNALRPDRDFGPGVPKRMAMEIRKGMGGLQREGFRQVWKLTSEESIDAAKVTRQPLWTDKRDDHGPFDIIGDIHGCADELQTLLARLGYGVAWSQDRGDRTVSISAPEGRKVVFVGDLVDRGPNSPDALRIAMSMVAAGTAYCVQGNHERKLGRWLEGRKVTVAHGLQETIDQLEGRIVAARGPARLPRFPAQPRLARRRQGRRRPCRAQGGDDRARLGRRARVRPLWRDHRRDRRVRPAGARRLGRRLSRQDGRGLWPHAGRVGRMGQQHPVHRHRLRVRRQADRPALARARTGRGPRRKDLVRADASAGRIEPRQVGPGRRRRRARLSGCLRPPLDRDRTQGQGRGRRGERLGRA